MKGLFHPKHIFQDRRSKPISSPNPFHRCTGLFGIFSSLLHNCTGLFCIYLGLFCINIHFFWKHMHTNAGGLLEFFWKSTRLKSVWLTIKICNSSTKIEKKPENLTIWLQYNITLWFFEITKIHDVARTSMRTNSRWFGKSPNQNCVTSKIIYEFVLAVCAQIWRRCD